MEIHFIWIRKYEYLERAGINFSARFIIEMISPRDSSNNYILSIKDNPHFIPNFFGKSNIQNITAIIGKNGAGKTTILNYIRKNLPEGVAAGITDDLFVYSRIEDEIEKFHIVKPLSVNVELENESKTIFEKTDYGDLSNDLRFNGGVTNADYIFYQYLLNFNENAQTYHGERNISTAYLMLQERKRILEESQNGGADRNLLLQESDLDRYHISEVARAIQLLSANVVALPFSKPEALRIELDLSDAAYFRENQSDPELSKLLETFQSEIATERDIVTAFEKNLLLSLYINFLMDERKYGHPPYIHRIEQNEGENSRDYIWKFFKSLRDVSFVYEGKTASIQKYRILADLVPEFLGIISGAIQQKDATIFDKKTLSLSLNDQTETIFRNFSNLYLKIKGIGTIFKFTWRSLSSGEQSYLSFMSRFYHVARHEYGDLRKDLVILIDEGDMGYHPEWQRRYFHTTLNFLSELFKDHNLQIILTANTPFITSDLPKAHVLFIEKIENKLSLYKSKDNDRDDTFGANIHTLFSNSFYLKGVLIGEFAKEKINEIIAYLAPEKTPEAPPDGTYRKIIDQIGEPVLKIKLQDMWASKFGIDEEIDQLQKQIDILKQQKNKNKEG